MEAAQWVHGMLKLQDSIISPTFVQIMAAYNAEMNRRIYAAAHRLPDQQRRSDRGAFWGSIHGTLCHLVWADQMWMSRFDGWAKPTVTIKNSASLIPDFDELHRARIEADGRILAWATRLPESWLGDDQVWFSGATGREMRAPRSLLVTHFFNHQTHHRGQIHAMITAAGEQTGDTDLFLIADTFVETSSSA